MAENASSGRAEPFCSNCFYCFPDSEDDDIYTCDNPQQIFSIVKLDDYCFRHEPLDPIPS